MTQDLILIAALAAPVLVMIVLRINAAMVFLSLALGALLVQFLSPSAKELTNIITPHTGPMSDSTITLGFLVVPAVITAIFTVLSVSGRAKVMLNILPAAASSLLAILLAVPLLPSSIAKTIQAQPSWHVLSKSQALVVGVGAVMSLMFLWTTQRRGDKHKGRRH
jgi:hypothetical protein